MSLEWMRQRVDGFARLPEPDYTAITTFFWLWSFFEGNNLRSDGPRIDAIEALLDEWAAQNILNVRPFERGLTYFKARYFPERRESEHYFHLNMQRHPNHEPLVRRVLSGGNANDRDSLLAVLLVIYRLRNNLVHGPKWRYRLEGQLGNFQHANLVLVAALELDGRGLILPEPRAAE